MDDLLDLAFEDPAAARVLAEGVLAREATPVEHSYAHQCLGIIHREAGRTDLALVALRTALALARKAGAADRERDVRATYGGTLAFAGRTAAGLKELDRALASASGHTAARIRMRKAGVLAMVGDHAAAAPLMRRALTELGDDPVWEGRTRTWLGHVELALGQTDAAEREQRHAEALLRAAGAQFEATAAVESLAEVAVARGDLPRGMRLYREALDAYRAEDREPRFLAVASAASTYLAAGLPGDALALLEEVSTLAPVEEAERQLLEAQVLLAAGRQAEAAPLARRAAAMFRTQRRDWFAVRARLLVVLCGGGSSKDARAVARVLHEQRAQEAPLALVLAGRRSRGAERASLWHRAASYRTHPNALVRAAAWHARSLVQEERGSRGGVLRAASAGLDAIDEHRRLIGSSELRALATAHGRELTAVALRHAASDPRTLLRWSERTRATALAQPPATSDAPTIPASLAALRDNGRRLARARQEGEPTEALERERLRLERAVRTESHTLTAATAEQQRAPAVEELVAAVGEGCLVELVDVDGTLHVLVLHAGRVRRRVAGTTTQVAALLGPAQMLLRRASRGRPVDTAALGRQLQDEILGDAVRLVPDGPVVLAPTARLHGLAWPLLPVLADRPFTVVPSAGQWLRARTTGRPRPAERRTVLVSGPGLASGGAEVPVLAGSHPDATLLAGPDATLERVLAEVDGADLVHLAAHGHFRADSPLFSALDLADGPLTVHDLERLRRAPYRVVLSACESGVLAPVGAEELLGLAAALFSLGTAGLVSSVAEVNDDATAALMVDLHAALAAGVDPAAALLDVRRRAVGDPVAAGTAAAFLALGT
ncbi:CHAT domain-containing protein [Nocardioides sp. J9]|uniref:CHAT domain-containing protein n=1 Tax=Nocardioides sp. J9 TaxID=935844 RepID=UPI00119D2FB1|nr:CHAT domain-containing protein [Nocardioides sp. J9]TWG95381.1 CHAT domain-containing protein [Nocardioides sp. J9]